MAIDFQPVHGEADEGTHGPENTPDVELTASTIPMEVASNGHCHVGAGRKGAHRVPHLMRVGRVYEQDHNLKRSRQPLPQLRELGKLSEEENGIAPEEEAKGVVR